MVKISFPGSPRCERDVNDKDLTQLGPCAPTVECFSYLMWAAAQTAACQTLGESQPWATVMKDKVLPIELFSLRVNGNKLKKLIETSTTPYTKREKIISLLCTLGVITLIAGAALGSYYLLKGRGSEQVRLHRTIIAASLIGVTCLSLAGLGTYFNRRYGEGGERVVHPLLAPLLAPVLPLVTFLNREKRLESLIEQTQEDMEADRKVANEQASLEDLESFVQGYKGSLIYQTSQAETASAKNKTLSKEALGALEEIIEFLKTTR